MSSSLDVGGFRSTHEAKNSLFVYSLIKFYFLEVSKQAALNEDIRYVILASCSGGKYKLSIIL